jgi:hypothetical protein
MESVFAGFRNGLPWSLFEAQINLNKNKIMAKSQPQVAYPAKYRE